MNLGDCFKVEYQ